MVVIKLGTSSVITEIKINEHSEMIGDPMHEIKIYRRIYIFGFIWTPFCVWHYGTMDDAIEEWKK